MALGDDGWICSSPERRPPTDVERAAVDALLGPAPVAEGGDRDAADHFLARGGAASASCGTSCCRRCTPSTTASAGSAGVRSTTSPSGSTSRRPSLRRGQLLRAVLARPSGRPRQVHVCVDLACRAAGGPSAEHDLPPGTHPSPCLGVCERAPAALVIEAGDPARRALFAPGDGGRGATHRRSARGPTPRHRWSPRSRRSPTTTVARAAAPRRRGRPDEPRRLPGDRRLRGAAAGARARPGRVIREVDRLRARRTRRRGVPDRPQVGRRRPPAGAPAPPRLQRRRVGARHVQGPGR